MRTLRKEKQLVYVAKNLLTQPVLDGDGNQTGEYYSIYNEPEKLFLNVKPITDIAKQKAFGEDVASILKAAYTPYDVSNTEISEFDAVWIEREPNGNLSDGNLEKPMNNDYFVYRRFDDRRSI